MVYAAKSTGSGHLLWPKDRNVEDAPADFVRVLNHALTILSWQENLMSEDMPPYWMWHLDWEIERHFDLIKSKREANSGTVRDNRYDKNEDGSDMFEQNELFAHLKQRK